MRRLRDKFFVPGWRSMIGIGMLATMTLAAGSAWAQPVNDNFANATDLDSLGTPGSYTDNNTAGSAFDTLLGVYTGNTVSNLTLVSANDNVGGGSTSKVTFNAVAGTVFHIAVDGANGVQGSLNLNWSVTFPAAASANDTFTNATVITGGSGSIVGYNLFATKESKFIPTPPPGTLLLEPSIAGNTGGASIWYSWTAPSGGVVTL